MVMQVSLTVSIVDVSDDPQNRGISLLYPRGSTIAPAQHGLVQEESQGALPCLRMCFKNLGFRLVIAKRIGQSESLWRVERQV